MRSRVDSIQALRAIAATVVVFSHAQGLLAGFKVKYGIGDAWLNLVDPVKVGHPSPVLAVGWTLSYEMYFYALVCIGLLVSRKVFIVGLGIYFLISTVLFPQHHGPLSNLTANTILWEFYAGVLCFLKDIKPEYVFPPYCHCVLRSLR